jgi:hypothetical protein
MVDAPPADASAAIVIEAEDFTEMNATGVHQWQVATDKPGYSGAGFIVAIPETDTTCTDITACAPDVRYELTITLAATYYLHARTYAESLNENSFYYAFDVDTPNNVSVSSDPPWQWAMVDQRSLSAGPHTLIVWMREDSMRIDQFAIATASSWP